MESNKKRKVLLIVNPCAGRTKSRAGTFDIVNKFSNNDYKFSIHTTTCQGDATNIVKRELGDNDLVVCCGGDGTLNETINGVMDMPRRVPIGYIPTGTTNDLATTLGIPSDIKKATDLIMSGKTNDYDLGLFNNRYYSYVASFGFCSSCSYTTPQKWKNLFGHSAYLVTGFIEAFQMKAVRMRVEYDGGIIEDDFVFGAISNSTSVGGFFKFKKDDVKLNDGLFEVLLVRNIPFAKVIPTIDKVRKQHYDGKEIIFLKTSKIKFYAPNEEVAWTVDGEYAGSHHNVMIHVLESAVSICSPENSLFIKREPKIIENFEPQKNRFFSRKNSKSEKKAETAEGIKAEALNAEAEEVTEAADEIQEKAEEQEKSSKIFSKRKKNKKGSSGDSVVPETETEADPAVESEETPATN